MCAGPSQRRANKSAMLHHHIQIIIDHLLRPPHCQLVVVDKDLSRLALAGDKGELRMTAKRWSSVVNVQSEFRSRSVRSRRLDKAQSCKLIPYACLCVSCLETSQPGAFSPFVADLFSSKLSILIDVDAGKLVSPAQQQQQQQLEKLPVKVIRSL